MNYVLFAKKKQTKKYCEYTSSAGKELTQYVVLYFTEAFNRMSTLESFTWKRELASTAGFT